MVMWVYFLTNFLFRSCFKFCFLLIQDIFELQKNRIKPGQKVLLIDDLLATGGSLEASINLVKQAGGQVVEALVIMELSCLKGRERLSNIKVSSLIQYDD